MPIGIYVRVSTENQPREGYSLEILRVCLESVIDREGYRIHREYCNHGVGA